MKRMRYVTQTTMCVVLLMFFGPSIGGEAFAQNRETEENIKGRIAFDFPNAPEAKVEVNLSRKLISLLGKAAKSKPEMVELIEMLKGVYARVYDNNIENFDDLIRHYEKKLKTEQWELVAKVKEQDEAVLVSLLLGQEKVHGIFVMVAGQTETTFVNIVGDIDPERIGELLENLEHLGLPSFEEMDIKADDASEQKNKNESQ